MKGNMVLVILLILFLCGLCDRSLNRPTRIEPVKNEARPKPRPFFPCRNAKRLSFKGDEPVAASVAGLVFILFPHAISRLIISVVINPLNRMLMWSFAHINFKIPKVQPSITNLYPAAAIVFPVRGVWVSTASQHCAPASVFARKALAVFCVSRCNSLRLKASARLRCAVRKCSCFYNSLFSAVTNAKPAISKDSRLLDFSSNLFCNQTAKSFSGKVLKILVRRRNAGNYTARIDVVTHIGLARAVTLQGFRPLRFNDTIMGG